MLSHDQKARIADYLRVEVNRVSVNDKSDIFLDNTGEIIGFFKAGLALIDRKKGYAAIEADGSIRFRDGYYNRY